MRADKESRNDVSEYDGLFKPFEKYGYGPGCDEDQGEIAYDSR